MKPKWLLICGVIAGPLFIVTFLIQDSLRTDLNPIQNTVSALALGPHGWIQILNFLVTGILILLFARGIWNRFHDVRSRTLYTSLFGLLAISIIGAGLFTTFPASDHVAAIPGTVRSHLSHAVVHMYYSIFAFLELAASCFVLAWQFKQWQEPGWAVYSIVSGVGVLIFFMLAGSTLQQAGHLAPYGGLFERISIIIGLSWLSLLAGKLLCTSASVALSDDASM